MDNGGLLLMVIVIVAFVAGYAGISWVMARLRPGDKPKDDNPYSWRPPDGE
jgi:hypothetical protein